MKDWLLTHWHRLAGLALMLGGSWLVWRPRWSRTDQSAPQGAPDSKGYTEASPAPLNARAIEVLPDGVREDAVVQVITVTPQVEAKPRPDNRGEVERIDEVLARYRRVD